MLLSGIILAGPLDKASEGSWSAVTPEPIFFLALAWFTSEARSLRESGQAQGLLHPASRFCIHLGMVYDRRSADLHATAKKTRRQVPTNGSEVKMCRLARVLCFVTIKVQIMCGANIPRHLTALLKYRSVTETGRMGFALCHSLCFQGGRWVAEDRSPLPRLTASRAASATT